MFFLLILEDFLLEEDVLKKERVETFNLECDSSLPAWLIHHHLVIEHTLR